MIQQYGFNQRIGQLAFPQSEGGGFPEQRPYSDATAQAMDEEAKKMVDVAYERTLQLMREKKPEVTAIAEMVSGGRAPTLRNHGTTLLRSISTSKRTLHQHVRPQLLDKETINHDDIVSAIGHRPFEPNKQYAEFISNAWKRDEEKKAHEDKAGDEESSPAAGTTGISPA